MGLSVNGAIGFQNLLGFQKIFKMGVNGEVRKLPLNDPGEPDQGPHMEKADGAVAFFSPQNRKSGIPKLLGCDAQILIGKRQRGAAAKQLHQFPFVFRTYLLGDEQSAGFQNPVDFLGVEAAVAVMTRSKRSSP